MKFLLRHKGLLAAVIVIVLLLVMSGASLIAGGASPVTNFFGIIFRPVQGFMSGLTRGIESYYSYIYDYDTILAENAQLRLRIAEYERTYRDYAEAIEENERLRDLLEIRKLEPDLKFQDARIVARDLSNWSRSFTLDQGSSSGISKGNCVMSSEGYLVGMISEVGMNWSTMITVIDTDMTAAARIFRTGAAGVAEGDFELMQGGRLCLSYMPLDADIQNGDVVLTTGVGGRYPKDIPVGEVVDVRPDSSGISARAVLRPFAELDRLTQVFVVTEFTEG